MSWILILIVIHAESATTFRVPGFATEADCRQTGQAWASQTNKRPEQTDIAVFRCTQAAPR